MDEDEEVKYAFVLQQLQQQQLHLYEQKQQQQPATEHEVLAGLCLYYIGHVQRLSLIHI